MKYTLVLGVDRKHFEQLRLVLPTWLKHKPSIFQNPVVVFRDSSVSWEEVNQLLLPHVGCLTVPLWPPAGVKYPEGNGDKWTNQQRYKMLSGFVHVPAELVRTEYWLKLDTDVIAHHTDAWLDPRWFVGKPAIVAQKWGFTKPPNQILELDDWAQRHSLFPRSNPLGLAPEPGSSRVRHPRIISWCGFFNAAMTRLASGWAETFCGRGLLPVPSQDGYLWYVARRLEKEIRRVDMKALGWQQRNTMRNIQRAVEESLSDPHYE